MSIIALQKFQIDTLSNKKVFFYRSYMTDSDQTLMTDVQISLIRISTEDTIEIIITHIL